MSVEYFPAFFIFLSLAVFSQSALVFGLIDEYKLTSFDLHSFSCNWRGGSTDGTDAYPDS